MKRFMACLRWGMACAGLISLLALPGAISGFQGCSCPDCRDTPDGCFENDQCVGQICGWNGAECECPP